MLLRMRSFEWGISLYVGFLFLFSLTCTANLVHADDTAIERRLTISEAIHFALENNHEIKAAKDFSLAQEKDVGVARSYLLPHVSLEERYLRTTNPGWAFMSRLNQERIEQQDFDPDLLNQPDPINDYQSSLMIEQPIFVKKVFIGLDMSKGEALARGEELKRKQEEVAFQVIRACLMIVSGKHYVQAAQQGVKDAEEHLRLANLRYTNGLSQYSDVLRASTALTEARQKLNVADKNVNLAKRGLGLLLASDDTFDVEDPSFHLQLRDLSFYTDAAESRSDLRAAAFRRENAALGISMAEAAYFPYVGVGGTYQFNDHDKPFGSEGENWQVMAFLRWDLFDGTRREYERAKAQHLASQAQEYLSGMKKNVSYRIYESYLNAEEAHKNIELSREALKTAEEGARLLTLRYENGLCSLADLLNVQTSLEQARAGLVDHDNAYKIAVAALSYESGTILQDLQTGN